ncbi:MAG: M20 family metallopeptidase [Promethearchaeota archaeon]
MSEKTIDATPLTEEETKLLKLVDDHRDELIKLLCDMINIDSRTFDPSIYSDLKEIFNFVESFMKDAGAIVEYFNCPHELDEHNEKQVWYNLVARVKGERPGKTLQFNGHLDIVPFVEGQWRDGVHPLKATVIDGKVYGRGASDMKGGIAAQMMAFKLLKQSGIPFNGHLQMWFVPDEEINGEYGARFMAREHVDEINADGTIISEATGQPPVSSPAIILGEKGHKWLRMKVHGSAGHGSMPKPKSNSINKAARFISNTNKLKLPKVKPPIGFFKLLKGLLSRFTIKNLIKAAKTPEGIDTDPYDEDGIGLGNFFKTTVSFTGIKAGTKVNVIPDECELMMDIRVLPGISTQDVFDSLARYATKLGYRIKIPEGFANVQEGNKKFQKRPVDLEIITISCTNGSFVSPDKPFTQLLSRAFEDVFHVRAVYFFAPGSTDAVHMREQGIDNVVVFGPTGSNGHDSNEFVELESLVKTCKVYLLLAYRMLCKESDPTLL